MARPVVEIDGMRQLRTALRRGGDDLADLKEVNAQAARTVEQAARPGTPTRSGRLAASLRASGTKTQAVVRAGRSSVPYAGVIHFGWPARHITAQPWIVDAAQATEPSWTALYLREVERIINRITGEVRA